MYLHLGKSYLFREHMSKLILWTLKCKEGSNDEAAAKSKADGELLRHKNHDREEHGERNEDKENSSC